MKNIAVDTSSSNCLYQFMLAKSRQMNDHHLSNPLHLVRFVSPRLQAMVPCFALFGVIKSLLKKKKLEKGKKQSRDLRHQIKYFSSTDCLLLHFSSSTTHYPKSSTVRFGPTSWTCNRCRLRWWFLLKALEHCEQTNGHLSECVTWCKRRLPFQVVL